MDQIFDNTLPINWIFYRRTNDWVVDSVCMGLFWDNCEMFYERLYLVKSGEGHLARRQVVVAQVLLLDLEQEVERNDFLALSVTVHKYVFQLLISLAAEAGKL